MIKWEYKVEYLAHRGGETALSYDPYKEWWQHDLEETLNELGSQGWELVSFPANLLIDHVDGYALFKRRIDIV